MKNSHVLWQSKKSNNDRSRFLGIAKAFHTDDYAFLY